MAHALELGETSRECTEIQSVITLRGSLAAALIAAADVRESEPCEVLADIIEAVLGDGIVDAVLDDAGE